MQFPFMIENPRHHRMAIERTMISFEDTQSERHEELFYSLNREPDQNFAPSPF
jgi:hypothetical protein